MAITRFGCPRCGVRLKASGGKAKVRCPGCGTVVGAPPAADEPRIAERPGPRLGDAGEPEDEALDHLEEVDDEPSPAGGRYVERDDRPIRSRRRRRNSAWEYYLGPIAAGVAVFCFVVSFVYNLISIGPNGLPANREEGGFPLKLGALAFGVLVALVFAGVGVIAVHTRTFRGRWGYVATGPLAVVFGMIFTVMGGSLGGFMVYGLLTALIHGR
jgi:hypothetical protein